MLLVAFAVLPLSGAMWFAGNDLRAASKVNSEVAVTEALTDELILLNDLRTRLVDEYSWSTVIIGLISVGFPVELVSHMTQIDIIGGHTESMDDVDALLVDLGMTEMETKLAELRALGDSATPGGMREYDLVLHFTAEYAALEATVVARSDDVLDQLVTIAAGVDGGEQLLVSLRVLEAAAEARQSIASQLISYFITQFSDVVLPDLIETHDSFERSVRQITRLAPDGSRVAADLEEIRAGGETDEFTEAVGVFIEERLANLGGEDGVDVTEVVQKLPEIVEQHKTGSRAAEDHLALLTSAGADVVDAGADLLRNADAARTRAQRIIASLVLASLLLGVLVARAIVKPLRQLSASARLLKDGATNVPSESHGPAEVRDAADAIKEAAVYLDLVEQQATALANRELANPILAREAEGSIGRSLRSAVKTLTISINDGEEYRRRLAHDADHDSLTQLPNRRASLARLSHGLARSRRNGTQLAVLFLDLDGFKAVNDQHGHLAGDLVLQAVTARMRATVRDGDHVGRFGGDEFLVIAESVDGAEGAIALGERLLDVIETPIDVNRTTVSVGASIGIALPGDDGLTADEILRNADIAVYRAKQAGRRRVELSDDDPRLRTLD